MRAVVVAALIALASCSAPPGPTASSARLTNGSPSPHASCRLPIYWGVNNPATPSGVDIHTAFLAVPGGAITDAGIVPAQSATYGATYLAASNRWVGVDRQFLSPDGTQYAYWKGNQSANEVHVVDVATGADRTLYSGPQLYIVIGFEANAIYLVHAVNPRQGAFELLFTLDPAGGPITLATGSDRHMYQWGWVIIRDGAAWGIDNRVVGNDYFYSMLRLDLVTGQVTSWFESRANEFSWPLGTDLQHRLYIQVITQAQGVAQTELWRVAAGGQPVQLPNPGPIDLADFIAGPTAMVADSHGVWLSGKGVWLYADDAAPRLFTIGKPGVGLAGPCL